MSIKAKLLLQSEAKKLRYKAKQKKEEAIRYDRDASELEEQADKIKDDF